MTKAILSPYTRVDLLARGDTSFVFETESIPERVCYFTDLDAIASLELVSWSYRYG